MSKYNKNRDFKFVISRFIIFYLCGEFTLFYTFMLSENVLLVIIMYHIDLMHFLSST